MSNPSRIPGFYKMTVEDRKQHIIDLFNLTEEEANQLLNPISLPEETADNMIENVIGTFSLPMGLGLNFKINEKDYVVPMVVEEPSIIASASYIAKMVRDAGGFTTEATERIMIGQIQVVGCPDFQQAKEAIYQEKDILIQAANDEDTTIDDSGVGAVDHDV